MGEIRISVLGPKGTYSEKAVNQYSKNAEIIYCKTIQDAVEAVFQGKADLCIVPEENSLEGLIHPTFDLLKKIKENDLFIIGEEVVHIEHCFLVKESIKDVKMIYSKKEALDQCRIYIKNNFSNAKIYEADSTADAARKASMAGHIAAIASKEAAKEYGLKVIAENIQDENENYTRFVVIGKNILRPTGNDKISIIVYLKENKPGALYEILGEFASRKIDLTKIESRPTKKRLGEYIFYLVAKGHQFDSKSKIPEVLRKIKNIAQQVDVLGSYPVAN